MSCDGSGASGTTDTLPHLNTIYSAYLAIHPAGTLPGPNYGITLVKVAREHYTFTYSRKFICD
jgi:hypothetical protein